MIQKLLFKLHKFIPGIRFYKTTLIPKEDAFKIATFQTVNRYKVDFYFYRERCEEVISRNGKIYREEFTAYIIQSSFDEKLPRCLQRYNDMKFFFNSKYFMIKDENRLCEQLLSIYIDFLKHEIVHDRICDGTSGIDPLADGC